MPKSRHKQLLIGEVKEYRNKGKAVKQDSLNNNSTIKQSPSSSARNMPQTGWNQKVDD